MSQNQPNAIHCINPDCKSPYPQPWGNKFCNSCGASLLLSNRYIPLQRLGTGGFAQVFTIWDTKTQTEKVLKLLVDSSTKAQDLFAQEAAILSNWEHSGVPKVEPDGYFKLNFSTPQPRQLACLVMEKIEGETLEEIQQKFPQGCPQEWILNWLTQAIDILEDLHQHKIIHRDIKPSNIMLRDSESDQEAQLVLIDFGGVKQFEGGFLASTPTSSTRLFSSGYSPPEQIRGAGVGPAADFYALGRTMIELLTGKHPSQLEDPTTGDLSWRQEVANINPKLADLLDEMVLENVKNRPNSTTLIKKRLAKITQQHQQFPKYKISPQTPKFQTPAIFSQFKQTAGQATNNLTLNISQTSQKISEFFVNLGSNITKVVTTVVQVIYNTIEYIIKSFFQAIRACLDIIWAMILAAVGAGIGTIAGYVLAYRTSIGIQIAMILSELLPANSVNHTQLLFSSQILLFAVAGLGTSWGLTLAGGFGQKRRYLVASILSIIGYCVGWLTLQLVIPSSAGEGMVALILIAVSFLTLGLGLRSHHLVHAIIAAFGTASVFSVIVTLLQLSPTYFLLNHAPQWSDLPLLAGFFVFVGILVSFWLGISNYVVIPWLKLLGWR